MAAAGIALLQDPVRWQQMSTAAAADARRRFSENAVVAQYEAIYQDTLGSGASQTPTGLT
jgi:glycosyltransferase involved in cell wall biosynthesis